MLRILGNIIAFLSIYFLPWWLSVIVLVILMLIFKKFFEAIIYAFIFDLIYRASTGFDIFGFKITLLIIVIFIVLEWAKKYLRLYPNR